MSPRKKSPADAELVVGLTDPLVLELSGEGQEAPSTGPNSVERDGGRSGVDEPEPAGKAHTPPTPSGAPPGDTYGPADAGRVLGVTPRRVAQLVAAGKLEAVQERPLRVSAESVHRLRTERRSPHRSPLAAVPPERVPDQSIAAQVERIVQLVTEQQQAALEARESLLSEVARQRDELRERVAALELELQEQRRRKWWR